MSADVHHGEATAYVTPHAVVLAGGRRPDPALLTALTGTRDPDEVAEIFVEAFADVPDAAIAHAADAAVHLSTRGRGRVVVDDLEGREQLVVGDRATTLERIRTVTLDLGVAAAPGAVPARVTFGMLPASVVRRELCGAGSDDPFAAMFGATERRDVESAAVRERDPARPIVLLGSTGQRVVLDRPALLGRNPYAAGELEQGARLVRVDDPEVSRRHALVRMGRWTVTVDDLHSANGTTVELPDGMTASVVPGRPGPLLPGAVIRIGRSVSFTVEAVA